MKRSYLRDTRPRVRVGSFARIRRHRDAMKRTSRRAGHEGHKHTQFACSPLVSWEIHQLYCALSLTRCI